MDEADLIAVQDAVKEFGLSRDTIYRIIRESDLPLFKRRGDRRSYLRRVEIEQALAFRAKPRRPRGP